MRNKKSDIERDFEEMFRSDDPQHLLLMMGDKLEEMTAAISVLGYYPKNYLSHKKRKNN